MGMRLDRCLAPVSPRSDCVARRGDTFHKTFFIHRSVKFGSQLRTRADLMFFFNAYSVRNKIDKRLERERREVERMYG